jgi:NitT/TauT family transport system ATP-binding protein
VADGVPAVAILAADKVFANGVRALEPVTISVREGEFATIVGPSGCGKTTLLRMVAGLAAPSRGEVRLAPGRNTGGAPQRRLAFVFQSATLMAWANVERNVRLPLDLAGIPAARAAGRVEHALALVGLQDFRRAYPRQLSGGMQMRVSIARALVTEPSLLLMDEPFGALDEITRARLDRELSALWAGEAHPRSGSFDAPEPAQGAGPLRSRSRGALTILFVTHSVYEAVFLSTRVFVMSSRPGRIFGEIAIDEPHPRSDGFRLSERFARHCAALSEMLATATAETGGASR